MQRGPSARVAVVGGGLAGLTAAYRLEQHGLAPVLYEAAGRLGGRVSTIRGIFRDGQTAERGAEFIASTHARLLGLVEELGLEVVDLWDAAVPGTAPRFQVGGQQYPVEEAEADFEKVVTAVGDGLQDAERSDRLSVQEWIRSRVPGGQDSRLGRLLDVACRVEYGADTGDQSALNLLWMLGGEGTPSGLSVFGGSDDRFRVRGGSDVLVARLSRDLSDVRLAHRLVSARTPPGGGVALGFEADGGEVEVVAEQVVLAVPYRLLREADLTELELGKPKREAIRELGMGVHAKVHLGFRSRPWLGLGCTGDTLTDAGYQCTWEESLGQQGDSGILVVYRGGLDAAPSHPPAAYAGTVLAELEPVLPGVTGEWTGTVVVDDWGSEPFAKGSYSYFRVGQYSSLAPSLATSEGPVHFAGEHTCVDFQGYMEGAVRSGERAAAEIGAGGP